MGKGGGKKGMERRWDGKEKDGKGRDGKEREWRWNRMEGGMSWDGMGREGKGHRSCDRRTLIIPMSPSNSTLENNSLTTLRVCCICIAF